MEERKKIRPLGVIALILAALLLGTACFLCAGLEDWSLGIGRWGVYSTGAQSLYLTEAYRQTGPDDLLITDRRLAPGDGALVTYRQNDRRVVDLYDELLGRPVLDDGTARTEAEQVAYFLRDAGRILRGMHRFRYGIWTAAALLALAVMLLLATAGARWRKRQQKLMRNNFRTFGEKYAREDEDMDY
ncbi:MAG: hypothetical protein IK141_04745 [Clostridia bacterium]|nr:hypothetical protein [Clostridia bacterium]